MKNNFLFFFIFGVIARIFPFLLLPLIIDHSNDKQLSEFMLFISITSFLGMLFLFGTQFELTRVYFTNKKETKATVFNSAIIIFIIGIIVSLGLFFSPYDKIYFYSSLNALLISFISYLLVYYRISESVVKFGVVDVFRVATQYIVVLILLIDSSFSIELVVLSNAIWIVLVLFFHVLFVRKYRADTPMKNHKVFRILVRKGIKILPHYVSIFGLMLLDKVIIKEWSSDALLAQYAVGFMVGQLVILFTDAFNKVWGPYAIKTIEDGGRGLLIKKSKLLAMVIILISPLISIAVFFLSSYYFPEGYELAQTVAAIVSFVFVFQVIYFLVFPFIVHADAVDKMGGVSILSATLGSGVMLMFAYFNMFIYLPIGVLVVFLGQVVGMIGVLNRIKV